MTQTKSYQISKHLVLNAFKRVKASKGCAGIDRQSLKDFEDNLHDNLYKLWNRLSSGSYHPPPVMRVEIEKADGGIRKLGVPTVADRIAQMVVKMLIEPELEQSFHPDSYGYRPEKSAHQALKLTKLRCRRRAWVLDMDIKGFFDTIDHDLLMKAVRCHVKESWQLLYIERWLKAPVQFQDGRTEKRTIGTPQGGVISPLLANLFLHYVFDVWIEKNWDKPQFERYADDIVCHCESEQEAQDLKSVLEARFEACGLQLHPKKTKVVYCKGGFNRKNYSSVSFDFLGYSFGPQRIKTKRGTFGVYFLAFVSQSKAKAIRQKINSWPWDYWLQKSILEIQAYSHSRLQGWINYYGLFGKANIRNVLFHFDLRLSRWVRKKYKNLKGRKRSAQWVEKVRRSKVNTFPHW